MKLQHLSSYFDITFQLSISPTLDPVHYRWWDTHDQLSARATIVSVICASEKTYLTNISVDQHAWPLNLTIGNIQKDIGCTPKQWVLILVWLIASPPKVAKNTHKAWNSAVGIVLSPLGNLDITGPGLKCNHDA